MPLPPPSQASLPAVAVFPSHLLPSRPWAPALHSTVICAFKHNSNNSTTDAFPPTWTRLNPDPGLGMPLLAVELGSHGHMTVLFEAGQPIACAGFLPFRGGSWINAESRKAAAAARSESPSISTSRESDCDVDGFVDTSVDTSVGKSESVSESAPAPLQDWEICCFCVSPTHQGKGYSKLLLHSIETAIKPRGARRLFAQYCIESNRHYWPAMGFQNVQGATSLLQKGFSHTPGMEGLRADLHFQLGVKVVV